VAETMTQPGSDASARGQMVMATARANTAIAAMQAQIAVTARMCAALDLLSNRLAERQDFMTRLADAFWQMPVPPLPLTSLPVNRPDTGPMTGYFWAVQRITVGPIGTTTDSIHIYKSHSTVEQQSQTALNTLTGATSAPGAFLTWNPGRTGCLLLPDEKIGASGTITGPLPTLNWEVIQGEMWALPLFLV
jgi:hypothetical protein